eukprot:6201709-Pleurochrysis_carterae.AAC.1
MATDAICVLLKQEKHITQLVDTYLPEGVPSSFHENHVPAADDLPRLMEAALLAKAQGAKPEAALCSTYQSLVGALLYCSTQTRPDIATLPRHVMSYFRYDDCRQASAVFPVA